MANEMAQAFDQWSQEVSSQQGREGGGNATQQKRIVAVTCSAEPQENVIVTSCELDLVHLNSLCVQELRLVS